MIAGNRVVRQSGDPEKHAHSESRGIQAAAHDEHDPEDGSILAVIRDSEEKLHFVMRIVTFSASTTNSSMTG